MHGAFIAALVIFPCDYHGEGVCVDSKNVKNKYINSALCWTDYTVTLPALCQNVTSEYMTFYPDLST